ncbi:uncharacterized protein LOC118513849 [Anopheles stephensi]|uniref:Salivary thrombin inhibitor anophelin n=1 Tax=Anopheles stephensi TaxID=30069 RepID=SATPA_ANOST|nr:uncharacterized protein LOC118513849 [Anopheles stephensi]AAO06834.1 salivary anti-thrombin anophelin [Anopheles stephensi]
MASKVIVIALLCIALAAFVQGAPQYTHGEEPEYDEDDGADEPVQPHSSSNHADTEDDFDLSLLDKPYANAPENADPGRRPEFLKQHNNENQSDSSSGSTEN